MKDETPKKNEIINVDALIESLVAALNEGRASLQRAGEIIVILIDHDPKLKEVIATRAGLDPNTMDALERIGRRQMVPALCFSDTPGVRALRFVAYSDQVRYATEAIPVLQANGETLLVLATDLSKAQVKQVFTKTRMRTLGEQKNYLIQRQPPVMGVAKAYVVKRNSLVVNAPCELTKLDLLRILEEMA